MPTHTYTQALEKFSESMKDLKKLLSLDADNSAAKGEYAEVKHLWEKQLRKIQQQQQRQGGKQTSGSKKKQSSQQQKTKSGGGGKEKSIQQRELEQLLEETKSKVKQLKENPMSFSETAGSAYLNASKTTYYKPKSTSQPRLQPNPETTSHPHTRLNVEPKASPTLQPSSQPTSQLASTKRRRVVVEEVGEETKQEAKEKRQEEKTLPSPPSSSSSLSSSSSSQVQGCDGAPHTNRQSVPLVSSRHVLPSHCAHLGYFPVIPL